jgi:arylsulfatase A-like enzyme
MINNMNFSKSSRFGLTHFIFLLLFIFVFEGFAFNQESTKTPAKPNIILILTDDQGYEDVGFNGSTLLKTPYLDKMAEDGVAMDRFYVAPVCSPTRAGLMTGRYHYRTGVTNVGSCGDRIKGSEKTIADILSSEGYATAIYGKWHMGDNYPMRPMDKGFQEAIVHRGCCLYRDGYFDPILSHNGKDTQYSGYCMDVYTDLTLNFAEKNGAIKKPFFIFLSTNTPHSPLIVGEEYSSRFGKMGVDNNVAIYLGMLENIDYNIGRIFSGLKKLGIDDNTLVIFLSDNGRASSKVTDYDTREQFLRGKKADVYEGGIKSPCVFKWPGKISPNRRVAALASYVDIMPTILAAAGIKKPEELTLDGIDIMPMINGSIKSRDTNVIIQWHQGLVPQLNRSFTVIGQKYKLVQAEGGFHKSGKFLAAQYNYELFNIENDPFEQYNIAGEHPHIVQEMKAEYENWFWEVIRERGPDPELSTVGTQFENPVRIGGVYVEQDQDKEPNYPTGEYPTRIAKEGIYHVKVFYRRLVKAGAEVNFVFNEVDMKHITTDDAGYFDFGKITISAGEDWMYAYAKNPGENEKIFPKYIEIEWIEQRKY